MNLKDWEAMSPEEQEAYWEQATSAEKKDMFLQASKECARPVPPAPGFGGPERESDCCEIRNSLIEHLGDEELGVKYYSHKAKDLDIVKGNRIGAELYSIAADEFEHYLKLRGIIEILTEECGCPRQDIKPPSLDASIL